MQALQDAVTRWWFTTHGTHEPLSTPDKNGHAPTIVYLATCEECRMDLPFESPRDRARWMQGHMDKTGHKLTWSDVTATRE